MPGVEFDYPITSTRHLRSGDGDIPLLDGGLAEREKFPTGLLGPVMAVACGIGSIFFLSGSTEGGNSLPAAVVETQQTSSDPARAIELSRYSLCSLEELRSMRIDDYQIQVELAASAEGPNQPSFIPLSMRGLDLSSEQIERNIRILRLANYIIKETKLDFLVSGLATMDPRGLTPEEREAMGLLPSEIPDGYVSHYPGGAQISLSSYLNTCNAPEIELHIVRHELGHALDYDFNIYIDPESSVYQPALLPPEYAKALRIVVGRLKDTYWSNYFPDDNKIRSRGEAQYRWKFTNAAGERFWRKLLSGFTDGQFDLTKTFVLSVDQLTNNQFPAGSAFSRVISSFKARNPLAAQFGKNDLGKELMMLYWKHPELFETGGFSPKDIGFLDVIGRRMGQEFFAEHFHYSQDPLELFDKFPDLARDTKELNDILQAAAANR